MSSEARLLGDIGGTNARFALQREGQIGAIEIFPCTAFATLEAAIRHYLDRQGAPTVRQAAIAIATPVLGDLLRMTNHHWQFSTRALEATLGLQRLQVVNDFSALALAIPRLVAADVQAIGPPDAGTPGAMIALVGPGTGLGVAGLIQQGEHWLPLPGEGGHASLAPGNALEAAVLAALRPRHPHVSAERLLSGAGLSLLHETLQALCGRSAAALPPGEIVQRAEAGDAACLETIAVFTDLLGGFCGDVVLTLGARGGLYLGGGVLGKLGGLFDAARFRQRFEAKGRFREYLAAIPSQRIVHQTPALLGAASLLDLP